MSIAVNNNTHVQTNTQVPVDGSQVPVQGGAEKIAAEALAIIGGTNLTVSEGKMSFVQGPKRTEGSGKVVDPEEIPVLDDESVLNLLSVIDDLEKLIAELKSESTEEQIAVTKERIASLRDKLKQQHSDRCSKIDESMKQIDEATTAKKSQEAMGIISCIMAVVTAIVAVAAIAAAVFTGGASVAIGIAIIAGIGAACNVASAALTIYQQVEKDTLEQEVKDKAEQYRDQGMSASEAWKKASSDVNDKFLIANICLSIGGMIGGIAAGGLSSAGSVANLIAIIQTGLSAASIGMGIANAVVSSDASDKSYEAQSTQAELTRLEALLEKLKKALEEDNDEVQKLLQQLQEALVQLTQLLQGAVNTTEEIANNTGATA